MQKRQERHARRRPHKAGALGARSCASQARGAGGWYARKRGRSPLPEQARGGPNPAPPRNGEVAARSADGGVEGSPDRTRCAGKRFGPSTTCGGPPPRSGEERRTHTWSPAGECGITPRKSANAADGCGRRSRIPLRQPAAATSPRRARGGLKSCSSPERGGGSRRLTEGSKALRIGHRRGEAFRPLHHLRWSPSPFRGGKARAHLVARWRMRDNAERKSAKRRTGVAGAVGCLTRQAWLAKLHRCERPVSEARSLGLTGSALAARRRWGGLAPGHRPSGQTPKFLLAAQGYGRSSVHERRPPCGSEGEAFAPAPAAVPAFTGGPAYNLYGSPCQVRHCSRRYATSA